MPRPTVLPHNPRAYRAGKLLLDWGLWNAATLLALTTSNDPPITTLNNIPLITYLSITALLKLAILTTARLHLQPWSKTSFHHATRLATTLAAGSLTELALLLTAGPRLSIALNVPITTFAVSLLTLAGIRSTRRFLAERKQHNAASHQTPVVIVGAGNAGTQLARDMKRNPATGYQAIAFIDDNEATIGLTIDGIPVTGPINNLTRVLNDTGAQHVIIAIPTASGPTLKSILTRVRTAIHDAHGNIPPPRIVPSLREVLEGTASLQDVRDVRIEDLLQRDSVNLRDDEIGPYLHDKRILITGAGGSIGSELARRIARHQPKQLLLLGRGENSIFEIHQELSSNHPHTHLTPLIADVRHKPRIHTIFQQHQPDIVFHAAAHKHVPLMQAQPAEAVENNVLGTHNLLNAALHHGTQRFVNISSDKAVRPTSIMGATKRIAELLVTHTDHKAGPNRTFTSVRFGNVLGSRGSVVPTFKRQIATGGPITITDHRMTRYFMTIPEAANLVLHTATIAEKNTLYFLDMGEPVHIRDLAEDLIRLTGMEPGTDIEIHETGTRPGEKLYEELTYDPESTRTKQHPKILSVDTNDNTQIPGHDTIDTFLTHLEALLATGNQNAITACTMQAVKEPAHHQAENPPEQHSQNHGKHPTNPTTNANHATPVPPTQPADAPATDNDTTPTTSTKPQEQRGEHDKVPHHATPQAAMK